MDLTADIDIFFSDFGTTALFGSETVPGLLDIPSKLITVLDIGVGSTSPRFTMKSSDILRLGVDSGTLVTVSSANYLVSGPPEHDGEGIGVLTLENA